MHFVNPRREALLALIPAAALFVLASANGTDVAAVGTSLLTISAAALAFGLSMMLTENIAGLSIVHAVLNVVSEV